MDLSEKTQANQRAVKVRNALEALGATATDDQRINALKATATPEGFAQADALDKSIQERAKTKAVTGKDNAEAAAKTLDASHQGARLPPAAARGRDRPGEREVVGDRRTAIGRLHPGAVQSGLLQHPDRPGAVRAVEADGHAGRGERDRATEAGAGPKLIADERNKTQITTTGMTNATSRANNRDTIAAENVRAGVVPGGGMDENSERTAQAIASGQLPAPTGMAL
jgi:hypothetical protein